MDSLISPIASPNLNLSGSDKVVSGEIEALPINATGLKPGESLLLRVLLSENSGMPDTAVTSLKISLSQTDNSRPAEIKLDTPLQLPEKAENLIAVKIQSVSPEKVEVKLISINNEPPAKFIASSRLPLQPEKPLIPSQTAAHPLSDNRGQVLATAEKPLIVETGTAAKNVVFHDLELPQLIENIAKPLNLPENVLTQITNAFQGAKISVGLNSFVTEQIPAGRTVAKNPDYALLPEIDKPLQRAVERLRPVLTGFAAQITEEKAQPEQIRRMMAQIKNEMLPYQGQPFSGEAVIRPDNSVLAFKTVLGNVLPETVLKAEDGAKAVLEIKNISFPERAALSPLESLMASVRLIEEAPKPALLLPVENRPAISPAGHNIVSLLEPLKAPELQNISSKIIEKLPAFESNKMLANTVNFIKGAVTGNLEAWLGKETLNELKAAGAEGQEMTARLENLMNTSVRESVSWRQVEIPLFDGGEINKIRIAVKKPDDENEKQKAADKKQQGVRFVVDTGFSKLGAFQFDGFSIEKERRFDLIIRTSKALGNDLYANILRLFKTTLNDLEYSGNVKINVKENFIKVCEDNQYGETLKSGIYI